MRHFTRAPMVATDTVAPSIRSRLPSFLPVTRAPSRFSALAWVLNISLWQQYNNVEVHATGKLTKTVDLISLGVTDHNQYVVALPGGSDLFCGNVMKQGNGRNNGFGKKETSEEYQTRLRTLLEEYLKVCKANPNIRGILMQEAPIREEDLKLMADFFAEHFPDWDSAHFDMTDFGLMGFFKKTVDGKSFGTDHELEAALGDLKTRCQTFSAEPGYEISNIHVPHPSTKPGTLDECRHDATTLTAGELEKILRPIVYRLVLDDTSVIGRRDIFGDFNLNPDRVKAVGKKLLEEAIEERKKLYPDAAPVKLDLYYDSSPEGHRHTKGDKVEMLSVDGILSLRKQPADKYESDVKPRKLKYILGMFAGVSAYVADLIPEESALVSSARLFAVASSEQQPLIRKIHHLWTGSDYRA